MNNALLDIIDEIMNLIEDEKVETYVYNNNKFTIIDKDNNIDFQARLGNNNYYFKDNISELSFIKVKKYIDDDTTIQQILIEEQGEKCYYSYLERDGFVSLISAFRVEGKSSLVCNNLNVLNKKWEDIVKYADVCFERVNPPEYEEYDPDEDDEIEITHMEDEEIERVFGVSREDEYDDSEDEYDDEYDDNMNDEFDSEGRFDYEFNQIEENEKYGLSNVFEQNKIKDYEQYIAKKQECEENSERYDQHFDKLPMSEYTEAIEDYYSKYTLKINGNDVDGEAKARIIADCEAAVDEKAYDSLMFDCASIGLKSILEAVYKKEENER